MVVVEDYNEYLKTQDMVNHPPHYNTGDIEVISYIEDKLSYDGLMGYFSGNVIKYISRYRHKGGLQDVLKAGWYLNRMILKMEEHTQGGVFQNDSISD